MLEFIKRRVNVATLAHRKLRLPAVARERIDFIKRHRMTMVPDIRLVSLAEAVLSVTKRKVPGLVLECGCALGGSSILIASLKEQERPLHVYDLFGMIPPPTAEDPQDAHNRYEVIRSGASSGIQDDLYYGYIDNLYDVVLNNFRLAGIEIADSAVALHKGLIQDTLKVDAPVALAHIDVDWYDPTMVCLSRIEPHLSSKGILIVDDYKDWSGCRKAVDEYFHNREGGFDFDLSSGHMVITKRN